MLVQMPLWQRSSSLHSSTSAGHNPDPDPPPSPPISQATAPQPSPRPDLSWAPPFPSPIPPRGLGPFLSNHCPAAHTPLPVPLPPLPSHLNRRLRPPNASRLHPEFRLPVPCPAFSWDKTTLSGPGPAWVQTEARGSAGSGPVAGGTSTGIGAVGVEAFAVGEAKVALQALVHV